MLKLFMTLDGPSSREYQRALVTSLAMWTHHRKLNNSTWKMFKNNASAFNEEVGEICFSVLARGIASGGVRLKIDAVDERFKTIRSKIMVANDLDVDLIGEVLSEPSRHFIDPEGEDVKATVAHFQRVIRNLKGGNHRHYDATLGHIDRDNKARATVPAKIVPKAHIRSSTKVTDLIDKTQRKLCTYFVFEHKDIWPAAQPQVEPLSEDEDAEISSEIDDELSEDVNANLEKRGERQSIERRGIARANSQGSPKRMRLSGPQRTRAQAVNLIGRKVAIPSWKFGVEWANETYGTDYRQCVLHGLIQEVKDRGATNICTVAMIEDDGFEILLDRNEMDQWLVDQSSEEFCVDARTLVEKMGRP